MTVLEYVIGALIILVSALIVVLVLFQESKKRGLSGAIGGIAGCIEVLGVHGYFLNNFATGLGTNGMLAALITKNNIITAPIIAFFIAILKSGAMGMQQATSVPKALVDTITAVFIIFACMELISGVKKSKKKDKNKE